MDFDEALQPTGPTTGRSLVLFEDGGAKAGMQAVREAVGAQVGRGRPRARDALHRHRAGREEPRRAAALRRRV